MRFRPWLIAFALLTTGVLIAFAIRERVGQKPTVNVLPVPAGDREIAWFHTSTSFAAWEHFIAGVHRSASEITQLEIDDSRAFLERSTLTPEVVLSWKGRPGKLYIRWYKLSSELGVKQWLDALAQRDRPPLAIIGGGSSDRARDLARDLEIRHDWKGPRPLLLMTTATANEVYLEGELSPRKLTQVYPDRTFRFCFTNEQMARAVTDFVWLMPDLRPCGKPPNIRGDEPPPVVFPVQWEDDPYSVDLSEKFRRAVDRQTRHRHEQPFISRPEYSVGSFDRINQAEAKFTRLISEELPLNPGQRSLLIIPTGPTPARRFIRALTGEAPLLGQYVVAVTGDAININHVLRDGAIQWNMRDVPVPLVFFAHQNPIGWSDDLPPPTGTDEVLLFADLVKVLARAAFTEDGLAADADVLSELIRHQKLVTFDEDGNRADGEEYVVCLRPEITARGRINAQASLEVWRRLPGGAWKQMNPDQPLQAPHPTRAFRRAM
jgi:hypothetical protein